MEENFESKAWMPMFFFIFFIWQPLADYLGGILGRPNVLVCCLLWGFVVGYRIYPFWVKIIRPRRPCAHPV